LRGLHAAGGELLGVEQLFQLAARQVGVFQSAAAALARISARMNCVGIGLPLIGKLSTARWVCAP
jgi:hypothetical protein